jgi:hypothetical protein
MPKAIIKDLKYKSTIANKIGGNAHIYQLEMNDGTVGDYFSAEHPTKKEIGDEIEYELIPNSNPAYSGRIKEILAPKKTGFATFKKNESAENARLALMVAKDVFLADKTGGLKLSDYAEHLFVWLQTKSIP